MQRKNDLGIVFLLMFIVAGFFFALTLISVFVFKSIGIGDVIKNMPINGIFNDGIKYDGESQYYFIPDGEFVPSDRFYDTQDYPRPNIKLNENSNCIMYQIHQEPFTSNKCYHIEDITEVTTLLSRYNQQSLIKERADVMISAYCNETYNESACETSRYDSENALRQMKSLEEEINLIISKGTYESK